jgi:hypothetical protein
MAEPSAAEPAAEPAIAVPEPAGGVTAEPAVGVTAAEPETVWALSGFLLPQPVEAIATVSPSSVVNMVRMEILCRACNILSMRRLALSATSVVFALCAAVGLAMAEPPVRVPPGTRADADGQLVSGRGLRDTTDFIAKELDRAGIAVQQIGPYRERGVEVTRFVSATPSTPWLAVHVVRIAGKTMISFVTRPPS